VHDNPAGHIVGNTIELDVSGAVGRTLGTWQDAERLGLALMCALGFEDARLTGAGADVGIDIDARNGVCQVKHWAKQVGRREVQQLAGAATGRQAVFLASRYTSQAIGWANTAGIALFMFDGTTTVRTLNAAATALAARQVLPQPTDRERVLADRITRANRWLTALISESNHVAAEPVFKRRDEKRNAKKVLAFQRRLPAIRRGLERIEATTTLKLAPLARLDYRLTDFERELRAAAKELGIRLPD
jgi:hypothetical protein